MSRRNQDDFQNQDEAEEVQEHVQQEPQMGDASESIGEDLIEDAEKDYEAIDELDRYQSEHVDNQSIDLNPQARRKAQKELNRRDKLHREMDEEVGDFMDDDEDMERQLLQRRNFYNQNQSNDEEDNDRFIDAQEAKGKLHMWIKEEQTKRYIKNKFIKFLDNFLNQKYERIYFWKITDMLNENKTSIEIDYHHFKEANPTVALWLGLEPSFLIPQLNAILYIHLCKKSPAFKGIIQEVYVKFVGLPIHDRIRQLSVEHIEKLVQIKGVVTVRGEVFNQLKKIVYKCYRCGELKGPYFICDNNAPSLGPCRSCQSNGPYLQQKNRSVYRNYQKITVQQSPSDVDAGRIPRTKEVILTGDNVDSIKPGEEAQIIGIYITRYECGMNIKQGFPVFRTYVEANSVKKFNETNKFDGYRQIEFTNFAKRPECAQIIYNSIATSIYGHMEVKKALTYALFGGSERKYIQKMHRVRGDINVLLLGDPGIAKSQFLKSIQKIFHRCVYATGKGASAVGLTASVKQDSQTGEWKLEAGAMVLADKGICLIDEFDKMNQHDRTSIHEAMEQQTISISKAGIVANLNARCTVIAAANPIQGRYNEQLSFVDNVSLSDPILSRFDIIKVIKDKTDPEIDRDLSIFVINSHMQNHPYAQQYKCQVQQLKIKQNQPEYCDQQFLKQYIKYARQKFDKISINDKCANLIKQFYGKLRQSSQKSGGIRITTRHLQSMIRICIAHAKMHLRNQTIMEDADVAIRTMFRSYIETQKNGAAKTIQKDFRNYM